MHLYEVHLVGTWSRRHTGNHQIKTHARRLRGLTQKAGWELSFTKSNSLARGSHYPTQRGTFELTRDVLAADQETAINIAAHDLRKALRRWYCRPPRVKVL